MKTIHPPLAPLHSSVYSARKHLLNACWMPSVAPLPFPILFINHFLTSKSRPGISTLYPRRVAVLSPLDSEWALGILSRVSSPFPFLTHLGTDQLTQMEWWTEVPFLVIREAAPYTLFHMSSFMHVQNSHLPYTQTGLSHPSGFNGNLTSPSFLRPPISHETTCTVLARL